MSSGTTEMVGEEQVQGRCSLLEGGGGSPGYCQWYRPAVVTE